MKSGAELEMEQIRREHMQAEIEDELKKRPWWRKLFWGELHWFWKLLIIGAVVRIILYINAFVLG